MFIIIVMQVNCNGFCQYCFCFSKSQVLHPAIPGLVIGVISKLWGCSDYSADAWHVESGLEVVGLVSMFCDCMRWQV